MERDRRRLVPEYPVQGLDSRAWPLPEDGRGVAAVRRARPPFDRREAMTVEPEPTEPTEPVPTEPTPDEPTPEEEEEEAAQEPATPPPEPASQVDMEKAVKALGREVERHGKRVAEIMGPDFEGYDPCALCETLGFVPAQTRLVQAWQQNGATRPIELASQASAPED